MKVLLVQPPIEDFYDTSIRTYPLALAYIAGAIEGTCDVSILDFRTGYKPRKAQNVFPELAPYYRDDRKTPFSLFTRYSRYGMDISQIRAAIMDENPDLVGVSSSFTAYAREAIEIAVITKQIDPNIITVIGGTHPTIFPGHVIDHPDIDYVIRGEGETPFARLIDHLSSKGVAPISAIPGLCFKQGGYSRIGEINHEEHIDILPARHLIPPDTYRIGKRPYTFLLTSRGCPFQCDFCGKPPHPYRRRMLRSIEEEIDVIESMGIKAVDFEDDMLNLDIPFFHAVVDLLKGRELTLSAMNGIYSQNLDIPTLKKMYECGFRRLNFSLVDTSLAVHFTQKRAYPANLLEIMDWLECSPYLVEAHFIIGLPGQAPAEIINTMTYLMGKRLLPGPSIFYPAPGSPLFD
ncbi:MAG: cobalamin-dependent protein, partial [Syntrophorhabdus sp.]